MSTFVREFLQVTKESAFGTIMTTPVRGTDQIVIRLPGSNNFSLRGEPVPVDIPYGGGYAVMADTVSDKAELKGHLQTTLCYSQAALLLEWGLTKINTAQTAPWVTTEPVNDLASCTIDHAIWDDDTGAYKRTRYTGVKVSDGKIDVSEQSQYGTLDLGLVGSTYQSNGFDASTDPSATDLPVPADNEYATDFVQFIDSNGALTLGSGTFAQYESLSFHWTNKLHPKFFASRFAQKIRCYGRDLGLDADITLVANPDYRQKYQTIAALPTKVVFTGPSTHAITLDLKGQARIKSLADDLQLDKLYSRKLSVMGRFDRTASTDFLLTVA